ncbi:MAG TPA: FAD-binding protein [Pseudomonas sp.]|nr:FAD-binding protein [Pseudomonas sp.]
MLKGNYRFLDDLTPTSTRVEPPLNLEVNESSQWDAECDVLVIGLGLAGISTILKTCEDSSLQIIGVDRGLGGGTSAVSGGVVYAGGTKVQRDLGVDDSAQNMADYLLTETGDVATPEIVRQFAQASSEFIPWLQSHGARFGGPLTHAKTSYPGTEFLYFSGNERAAAALEHAAAAPRGHRAKPPANFVIKRGSQISSGPFLMDPLIQSAEQRSNVRLYRQTRVTRLIINSSGAVVGAQMERIPAGLSATVHGWLYRLGTHQVLGMLGMLGPVQRLACRIERAASRPLKIRARHAVVIAAGGFTYNRAMMNKTAPAYSASTPLGTIADDGSGIKLGMSVGGAVDRLDVVSAWRFTYPPASWTKSISVDSHGHRLVNEELYSAHVGKAVFERAGARAWLIYDALLRATVDEEARSKDLPSLLRMQAKSALSSYTTSAASLDLLAEKIGVPARELARTVERHNQLLLAGQPDEFGKADKLRAPVLKGPFYATDIGAPLKYSPIGAVTMGGLVPDQVTGQVLNAEGMPVAGLFVAGRTAVGICSNYYVSGLSLADCVWSGWRVAETIKGNGGIHAFVSARADSAAPANASHVL